MRRLFLLIILLSAPLLAGKESPMAKEIKRMKFEPLNWSIPTVGKEIEKVELPSGTVLYLKENHNLPLIEISIFIKGGIAYLAPGDKLIPDLLLSSMLKGGTKSFEPDELIDSIEINAIKIDSRVEDEYLRLTYSFQPQFLELAIKLIDEMIFYPAFNPEKVEEEKAKVENYWTRYIDDAENLLSEVSKSVLFTENPISSKPNLEKFRKVTREDLVKVHKMFFQPKNMVISVVGYFNSLEMKSYLIDVFDAYKNNDYALSVVTPKPLIERKVYFVQKEVPQGYVYIVQDAPCGYSRDLVTLLLVGDILGGGFNSKIVSKVRNELGLAYNTYAYFSVLSNIKGVFYAFTATRSDALHDAIYYMEEAIKQMINGNITKDELELSKESFLSSTVTSINNDWNYLQRLALRSLFGFPDDYLLKLRDEVAKQNLETIKQTSAKYLQPEKMAIIVVGDSTKIDMKKLEEFGPIQVIEY
jgi:zinc protease